MFELDFLYWMLGIFFVLAVLVLFFNTVGFDKILPIVVVESQEEWVVDRLGKDRVLTEGLNRILPGVDRIEAKVSLKEVTIDPPAQNIITNDQIKITVDMIATIKVIDSMKAVMEVDDYKASVESLVMTSVLTTMATRDLADIQTHLDDISKEVIAHIEEESLRWGVKMIQVRFEDISYSDAIKATMEKEVVDKTKQKMMLADAKAKSDAAVTEAEGFKKAAAFKAEALVHEIETLQNIMPDMSNDKILEFLKSLDYIHSMKNLSSSDNAKFVVYPSESSQPMNKLMGAEYLSQAMGNK